MSDETVASVVEEAPAIDPIDVSPEEMEGTIAAASAMTAMYWRAQLEALDREIEVAAPEQKQGVTERRQQVAQAATQAINTIPGQLKNWQDGLVRTAKETGVPVSVLAEAKNKAELDMIIVRYKLTHPEPAKPAAKKVDAPEKGEDSPVRVRQTDSGVSVGAGGEDWRNLSAMEKIKYALAGKG
jgi:hypothetical protein